MKDLERFTQQTIERIQAGELKTVQDFIDELDTPKMHALVKAKDADVMEAKVALIEIARWFLAKETSRGTFELTSEEILEAGMHLHSALAHVVNVRRGDLVQHGPVKLATAEADEDIFSPSEELKAKAEKMFKKEEPDEEAS